VGRPSSEPDDRTGGGTVSFVLPADHPDAAEVHGLLQRVREQVNALWRRAARHNEAHPPPEGSDRLTFYFGQHWVGAGEPGPDSVPSAEDVADVAHPTSEEQS
jgi:hypothetical protein